MSLSQYGKLMETRKFRTRAEAETYAAKVKSDYKQSEAGSVKIDIKFNSETKEWTALLYLKV